MYRVEIKNITGMKEMYRVKMKKGIEKQGKCDYSSIWKENSIEKRGACCSRLRVGNRCLDP